MVEQVFDNMRKASEATLQFQQEIFRQWANAWPGVNTSQATVKDTVQTFQKKAANAFLDAFKKQHTALNEQFDAGLKIIEEAFNTGEVKNPEELHARLVSYWQKSFEYLRRMAETQVQAFQTALAKWAELMTPSV